MTGGAHTHDPVFPQKTNIVLNLLDEKTGQSINIDARLTGILKDPNGDWHYRIRWKRLPEFLDSLVSAA